MTVVTDVDSGGHFSGQCCQVCGFHTELGYFYTFLLWVKVKNVISRMGTTDVEETHGKNVTGILFE